MFSLCFFSEALLLCERTSLATTVLTERACSVDAVQHVQTLTSQLQTLTSNASSQPKAQTPASLIDDAKVLGKRSNLDPSKKSAWNDLMIATQHSVAADVPDLKVSLNNDQEQDRTSTLHFLPMMTTAGKALDIVGNVGEGEGLEGWRRLVLQFDQRVRGPPV